MAILYNIYSNGGTGGPVDYTTPVASTPGLSLEMGPLSIPGDYTFAVRACDQSTGLEEANTDASVRIVLGADGTDITQLPSPPSALCLSASAGGSCRVSWTYRPSRSSGVPDGFQILLTCVGSTDPGCTATVPFIPGQVGYSCELPGPFVYATYTARVQAYNTIGLDSGNQQVTNSFGQSNEALLMDPVTVQFGSASQT